MTCSPRISPRAPTSFTRVPSNHGEAAHGEVAGTGSVLRIRVDSPTICTALPDRSDRLQPSPSAHAVTATATRQVIADVADLAIRRAIRPLAHPPGTSVPAGLPGRTIGQLPCIVMLICASESISIVRRDRPRRVPVARLVIQVPRSLCKDDVVGITIWDFALWPDTEARQLPMLSRWRMTEQTIGATELGQIQLVFLELPKYDAPAAPAFARVWRRSAERSASSSPTPGGASSQT